MAVIPIVIEGRRQPVRRTQDNLRKSGLADTGRRGSYGRVVPTCGRKGSNGRITYEPNRRGSYGRIGIDNTRRGSIGRIGVDNARRGSYGRIGIDNARRGSIGRKGSAADMTRRGSTSRKIEDSARRGSIGRKLSETRFQNENILGRRGSGAGPRLLMKKCSRQNLKSFQIKISLEGEEEEEEAGEGRKEKGRKDEQEKENIPTGKTEKKSTGRWENVDLGVARVRGGGDVKLHTISRNQSSTNLNSTVNKTTNQNNRKVESQTITSSGGFSNFAKDAVNTHNKYRACHSAKPLVLDKELCKHSQKYAEKLANSCTFEHSGDPNYGENLYWAWSSDPNFSLKGCEAVDSWYEESLASYDYSSEPTDTESGHFTQVVWSSSERLGVGLARSSTGRHIVVMKYDPPGNYVGQYTKHVHKPTSTPVLRNRNT